MLVWKENYKGTDQSFRKKQARKLQAMLVRNYDSLTHLLTH